MLSSNLVPQFSVAEKLGDIWKSPDDGAINEHWHVSSDVTSKEEKSMVYLDWSNTATGSQISITGIRKINNILKCFI